MSCAVRHPGLVLTVVVAVSAAARFAGARSFGVPWIAPDEMAYGMLGESLWRTGELTIRGSPIGFYSLLYPALVGGPLSAGGLARGIETLQAAQAVVMSGTAVPVYLWGRRMMGERWALVAAVLTVAPPALAYSGLIMSEALFYPVTVVALLALARAVQEPTVLRQGVLLSAITIAAAVRLQALVLVPTAVTAIVVDAVLARDVGSLRRYRPLVAALAAALAIGVVVAVAAGAQVSWSGLLGAYETVGTGPLRAAAVAREVAWSAGDLYLLSFGIPFLATALLVLEAAIEGEPDVRARAFLATTAAYVAWLVIEVALFAATHVDYVAERYLVTAAPLLFLGLCLWLHRGARLSRRRALAVVVPTLALVLAIPSERLFQDVGAHDLLTTLPFFTLADGAGPAALRGAVVGSAALVATAFVLAPRRRAPALAIVVAIGLAALSLGSAREIGRLSRGEQDSTFGQARPDWIDAAARGEHVLLLNTGDREWTSVPRTAFWNAAVTAIARLPQAQGSGAIPQSIVQPGPDGVLRTVAGTAVDEALVAAPTEATLAGDKLAEIPPTTAASGLALWRVGKPIRLESLTDGLEANGNFGGPVRVTVFACGPGRLELTLLGKSGGPIAISANGIPLESVSPPQGGAWRGAVASPPDADGSSICVFELSPTGLAGSTRIAFVRG